MPPDDTGLALRTVGAFRLSRAVWLAARLRLADLVGEGSASVTELAAASDTDADALERLMQALAAFGVFRREDGGRFAQTPTSEADPFPPFAFAVDVGGSQGSLLRRLLERQPHARGLLFDLPEVIARWRSCATSATRSRRAAGSRSSRPCCPTPRPSTPGGSSTSTCLPSPAGASAPRRSSPRSSIARDARSSGSRRATHR